MKYLLILLLLMSLCGCSNLKYEDKVVVTNGFWKGHKGKIVSYDMLFYSVKLKRGGMQAFGCGQLKKIHEQNYLRQPAVAQRKPFIFDVQNGIIYNTDTGLGIYKMMVERAEVELSGKVLDMGAGSDFRLTRELLAEGMDVVALDPAIDADHKYAIGDMVGVPDHERERIRQSIDWSRVHKGTAQNMDMFADAEFDWIVSISMLNTECFHLYENFREGYDTPEDLYTAIAGECARVLKPNGHMLISVNPFGNPTLVECMEAAGFKYVSFSDGAMYHFWKEPEEKDYVPEVDFANLYGSSFVVQTLTAMLKRCGQDELVGSTLDVACGADQALIHYLRGQPNTTFAHGLDPMVPASEGVYRAFAQDMHMIDDKTYDNITSFGFFEKDNFSIYRKFHPKHTVPADYYYAIAEEMHRVLKDDGQIIMTSGSHRNRIMEIAFDLAGFKMEALSPVLGLYRFTKKVQKEA